MNERKQEHGRSKLASRQWLRRAIRIAGVCFAPLAAEGAARLATESSITGMPLIQGIPLVPFRPPLERVTRRLDAASGASYVVGDATLGWCVRPGASIGLYSSSAVGARAAAGREFSKARRDEGLRVVAVGDSFVHCDEVSLADSWPVQLEQARPGTEVLNFGVPGYGTDQALLRWRRDARDFAADVALLGIWPEDICRNVSRQRYFLNPAGDFGAKPGFALAGDAVRLMAIDELPRQALVDSLVGDTAVGELRAGERWYSTADATPRWYDAFRSLRAVRSLAVAARRKAERDAIYWSADDPAIELTVRIVATFAQEARAAGSEPWVVFFPMDALLDEVAERGTLPIVARVADLGVAVLDLAPQFAASPQRDSLFTPRGHLTGAGNRLVAEALAMRFAAAGRPPSAANATDQR